MKRTDIIFHALWLVGLAAGSLFGIYAASVFEVRAAADCPGPGSIVRVIPGAGNNLRPNAGGDIAGNTKIKTLHFEDGEQIVLEGPIHLNGDDWLRVEGGWMWNHSLGVVCAPTVTATPTATRTATSTPRATSGPVVTPTRLARQLVYCSGTPEVTEVERGLWRVTCEYR